jgi:hypothetical protein
LVEWPVKVTTLAGTKLLVRLPEPEEEAMGRG